MFRRTFISLLGGAAVTLVDRPTRRASGQERAFHRIGILATTSAGTTRASVAALLDGMAQFGYLERRDFELIQRYADGDISRLPTLADDLVRSRPKVMVVSSRPAIAAARSVTSTIPIVMAAVGDPVEAGFVASLARPGGNITGLSNMAPQLSAKRLEILKELVPALERVAVVRNPSIPTGARMWEETESAARALGLKAIPVDIAAPAAVEPAFAKMVAEKVQATVFLSDAVTASRAPEIVRLAADRRLPVMYPLAHFMEAGGLVLYGPDSIDLWRRAAYYVDRILKGARPADLPVEQPTRFRLVINLKTAKALGLTVPPTLLARADEVIE
jgi:putative ABC transport system substrate-binding protein